MVGDDTREGEKLETSEELADLLRIAQAMGQRLAYEAHGELYDDVRVLIEFLHQARTKADAIQQKLKPK